MRFVKYTQTLCYTQFIVSKAMIFNNSAVKYEFQQKKKNLNGTKVMMMMLDSEFIRMIQFLKIQNEKKKNQPTYRWKHEEDGKYWNYKWMV